jgi:hypothetical protein
MFFDQGMTTGAMECAAVSQTTLPWLKKLVREHLYASLTNEALVIQGVSVEERLVSYTTMHPTGTGRELLLFERFVATRSLLTYS